MTAIAARGAVTVDLRDEAAAQRQRRFRTRRLREAWAGRCTLCRSDLCAWVGIIPMPRTDEGGNPICSDAVRGRPCAYERKLYLEAYAHHRVFSPPTAALIAGLHVTIARAAARDGDAVDARLRLARLLTEAEARMTALAIAERKLRMEESKCRKPAMTLQEYLARAYGSDRAAEPSSPAAGGLQAPRGEASSTSETSGASERAGGPAEALSEGSDPGCAISPVQVVNAQGPEGAAGEPTNGTEPAGGGAGGQATGGAQP